jgi:plastocyanin
VPFGARLAAALVALLPLAACGDGNGSSGPPATVPGGRPLEVSGDEYSFEPSRAVAAAGELEIVLDNRGSLAHNLKLMQGDRDLGGTATFRGGESRRATVRLGRGDYRMVCTVGNHEQLGMVGSLKVR